MVNKKINTKCVGVLSNIAKEVSKYVQIDSNSIKYI